MAFFIRNSLLKDDGELMKSAKRKSKMAKYFRELKDVRAQMHAPSVLEVGPYQSALIVHK